MIYILEAITESRINYLAAKRKTAVRNKDYDKVRALDFKINKCKNIMFGYISFI